MVMVMLFCVFLVCRLTRKLLTYVKVVWKLVCFILVFLFFSFFCFFCFVLANFGLFVCLFVCLIYFKQNVSFCFVLFCFVFLKYVKNYWNTDNSNNNKSDTLCLCFISILLFGFLVFWFLGFYDRCTFFLDL